MKKPVIKLMSLMFVFGMIVSGCSQSKDTSAKKESTDQKQEVATASEKKIEYNPPKMEALKDKNDPLSESIKYGQEIMMNTNTVLDGYVGNQLSCASCHAGAGTGQEASLVGITAVSPEYNPRAGAVITVQDRINGCMVRSMNGEKLPHDSAEMRAMVAYLTYISEGVPVRAELPWRNQNNMKEVPKTDVAAGEKIYKQSCLSCHGANGEGTGANTGPAVWGENSFNDGAGLARISKMASFIQRNMPVGQPGTLTDQQAADVAAYILAQDRPKWKGRAKDWPKGGAPKDVPYYDELESAGK